MRPAMKLPVKLHHTTHGPMYALAGDTIIGRCLETYGEWSLAEWKLLAQFVRPGRTVVEVGANIGVHTVALARACSPGVVYAFEPQPVLFELLNRNLALNDITNVVTRQEACGAAPGEASIPPIDYARRANFGGVALGAPGEGAPVKVVTLDSLELPACHVLKVDVEGWEQQVLEGAADTIRRCRPRLYVENDRPKLARALIETIAGMDYRLYWHTPPIAPDEAERRLFDQRIISVNMLCLPAERGSQTNLRPIDPADWVHPVHGEIQ